jgi:hypothetical protein
MKMRRIRRIQVAMRNPGYDLPDWVRMLSYWFYYTPDQDSCLPYREWSIDSHTKFS